MRCALLNFSKFLYICQFNFIKHLFKFLIQNKHANFSKLMNNNNNRLKFLNNCKSTS